MQGGTSHPPVGGGSMGGGGSPPLGGGTGAPKYEKPQNPAPELTHHAWTKNWPVGREMLPTVSWHLSAISLLFASTQVSLGRGSVSASPISWLTVTVIESADVPAKLQPPPHRFGSPTTEYLMSWLLRNVSLW